jgi:dihydrolipoamide dehydrogenase
LPEVPKRLLVIGGGYIGLELGLVYAGLGSKVAVAEFLPRLLMGADQDLVNIMIKQAGKHLDEIMLESKVVSLAHDGKVFKVDIEHNGKVKTLEYDQVLASIGRRPNSDTLALEKAGIEVDAQGHIRTDAECRTTQREVFAIGDVAPGLMLAHKASREGKVAAEVIAGANAAFDNIAIPAVVFTDPEIAWSGLTEAEASEQGLQFNVGKFPLAALGRARTLGRTDGMVKVISQKDTNLILGVGMVGLRVSELIAEATLALEMGATLEDLMVTIHPHPTLSESILEAAEMAAGTAVHVNPPRKRGS